MAAYNDPWTNSMRYFHATTVIGKMPLTEVMCVIKEKMSKPTFREELLVYYSLRPSRKTPEGLYKAEFTAADRQLLDDPWCNPERFDVTLCDKLLRRLRHITGFAFHDEDIWTKSGPYGSNTSLEYMAYRIKDFRNEACHNTRKIGDTEVANLLDELELLHVNFVGNVLSKLGSSWEKINSITDRIKYEYAKLKNKVIDPYRNRKGKVILFNMITFDDPKIKNRTGAEIDSVAIRKVFQIFGRKYVVTIYESYTAGQVRNVFRELQDDPNMKEIDSLIIFISSHGKSRYEFYCKDDVMDLRSLRSMLYETPEGCPSLKDNAKILIANYCQGKGYEAGGEGPMGVSEAVPEEAVGVEGERIPVARNIKTFFSTSDGVPAWRRDKGGNYFLQNFCRILRNNPAVELQQLIFTTNTEVEQELNFRSTFSEEGSRFNHFYF